MKYFPVIIAAGLLLFLSACQTPQEKLPDNVFYTCSMDPQVMEKKPGKCPICHMELTKTMIDKNDDAGLSLSEQQIQLGGIRVDTLRHQEMSELKTLTGITVLNETRTAVISSRVNGRVERLRFKSVGETVRKGDYMYAIYSEDLLAAEREFLLATEQGQLVDNADATLADAARNRLRLWGWTDQQLAELQKSKEYRATLPIYSAQSGTIQEIMITEGQYVLEGAPLFKVADLSSLWVEAQLYAQEQSFVSANEQVEITLAAYPAYRHKGTISFAYPELTSGARTAVVRMEIPNTDGALQPGLQAYVSIRSGGRRVLALPPDAVLRGARSAIVWIQNAEGRFESKTVETGAETREWMEIKAGLREGERVVVSGAYLLNSEWLSKYGSITEQATHPIYSF